MFILLIVVGHHLALAHVPFTPFFQVGAPGPDALVLVESAVVTKFISTAFQGRGSELFPKFPASNMPPELSKGLAASRMDLFVDIYMSTLFSATNKLMNSRTQESLHSALLQFLHGLVKCDTCLQIHGSEGTFLIGEQFSFAECMTAPFVVR